MAKKHYRVRNWSDYNKALVKRGSVTLWFDEKNLENWHCNEQSRKRGRPYYYSELAIECALSLRAIFHLTLRATQGFMSSLRELMQQPVEIPHYSTLCRRQEGLSLTTYHRLATNEPIHLMADSSGIKIYGEGEWKVKMHGISKRRTWRKLHIGLNPDTGEIITHHVTLANVHDAKALPTLLEQVNTPISQVTLDGIYDTVDCYEAIANKNAIPIIPPRTNAAFSDLEKTANQLRNWTLTYVRYYGEKTWKQLTNYHQRSHVENAFFRLKTLFGHSAKNRTFAHQVTELSLRCHILNRFTHLGMPDSYIVD
jgi:hypothetical protein